MKKLFLSLALVFFIVLPSIAHQIETFHVHPHEKFSSPINTLLLLVTISIVMAMILTFGIFIWDKINKHK